MEPFPWIRSDLALPRENRVIVRFFFLRSLHLDEIDEWILRSLEKHVFFNPADLCWTYHTSINTCKISSAFDFKPLKNNTGWWRVTYGLEITGCVRCCQTPRRSRSLGEIAAKLGVGDLNLAIETADNCMKWWSKAVPIQGWISTELEPGDSFDSWGLKPEPHRLYHAVSRCSTLLVPFIFPQLASSGPQSQTLFAKVDGMTCLLISLVWV